MTSTKRRCRPSAILHSCMPGSRKQELTWRSRLRKGDLLHADMHTAFGRTRDGLDTACIELDNRRDLHDAACRGLEDVGKKTTEMKRNADDAYDRTSSHRDQCRRATKELVSAEEEVNDNLGRLGQLIKDTAEATQAVKRRPLSPRSARHD